MNIRVGLIACFMWLLLSHVAVGEDTSTINVRLGLESKLAELRDYKLTDSCHPEPNLGGDFFRNRFREVCVFVTGKMKVNGFKFDTVTFTKMEVHKQSLPDRVNGQTVISWNCSTSAQQALQVLV